MEGDLLNVPDDLLRSIASQYTAQVEELRQHAYHLLRWKGADYWSQLKHEATLSKNRVEFWKEQIAWGKIWANSRE